MPLRFVLFNQPLVLFLTMILVTTFWTLCSEAYLIIFLRIHTKAVLTLSTRWIDVTHAGFLVLLLIHVSLLSLIRRRHATHFISKIIVAFCFDDASEQVAFVTLRTI